MKDREVVFHLVSTTLPGPSNLDPVSDVQSNLVGSIRLLQRAVATGVRRVVFVSSGGTVYGVPTSVPISEDHPTTPICSYGIVKLAVEKYLHLFRHLHGLESVVLRLANPYGERQHPQASQGVIAVFLAKALRGEPLDIWGDGSVVRDYVYISDVVRALLAAMVYEGVHRVFNIGSGHGSSVNEVVAAIETAIGVPAERRYLDARPFDVQTNVLSIERAQRELSWTPQVELLEGISSTAAWLRATTKEI